MTIFLMLGLTCVINGCTTKYIVIIIPEPKQCTQITHLHKSSILVSLMPESAELTWHHLEQVAITPMEIVPDKVELEEHQVFVKTEDRLLAYIAAAATIAGGLLHLMMIGPFLKPSNCFCILTSYLSSQDLLRYFGHYQ